MTRHEFVYEIDAYKKGEIGVGDISACVDAYTRSIRKDYFLFVREAIEQRAKVLESQAHNYPAERLRAALRSIDVLVPDEMWLGLSDAILTEPLK